MLEIKKKIGDKVIIVRLHECKFRDCGKVFQPRSSAQKRCPDCQAKHAEQVKAAAKERARDAKLAKIRAKCDRINDANAEAVALAEGKAHECPFCGKITKTAYCEYCHRQGFDNVHKMFGTTNGWDRRKKQNKIVSGWRGRAVIGFKSALCKNHA